jgi:hypothetical protein
MLLYVKIVAGFTALGFIRGLVGRRFLIQRVTATAFQCGLAGIYGAAAWWLASFHLHNFLLRYLLDGVIGVLTVGCLYQFFIAFFFVPHAVTFEAKLL